MTLLKLNELYANSASDRFTAYKSALSDYATKVTADLCVKSVNQWPLLACKYSGTILFLFYNHQRIVFKKTPTRLTYSYRTSKSRHLPTLSFRVLWLVQSPLFTEYLRTLVPDVDKAEVYLTYREVTDTFALRLSWGDYTVPQSEVLVQTLFTSTSKNQTQETSTFFSSNETSNNNEG